MALENRKMKIGMVGVLNNPASSINSHSAGWNEVMRQVIADQYGHCDILTHASNWESYDVIVVNHGTNFTEGSFNVPGGINQEVIDRVEKLVDCAFNEQPIYQIDGFQFDDFLTKRKLSYPPIGKLHRLELKPYGKTLMGDSHSISVWPGLGWNLHRMDGKTLHGFLKEPKTADFYYFGNVDIRFHLPRQENPILATIQLAERYIAHAKLNNAKVSCLLPVESESRKIPGTGLYNKQPFYGTRELRETLVYVFNEQLMLSGLDVHTWPASWYKNIYHYEANIMEPKQSVHIRPKYYAK